MIDCLLNSDLGNIVALHCRLPTSFPLSIQEVYSIFPIDRML